MYRKNYIKRCIKNLRYFLVLLRNDNRRHISEEIKRKNIVIEQYKKELENLIA